MRKSKRIQREPKNQNSSILTDIKTLSNQLIDTIKNTFSTSPASTRSKCRCDKDLLDNQATCATVLKLIKSKYNEDDLIYLKNVYSSLKNEQIEKDQQQQIKKDVCRTFPNIQFFETEEGQSQLQSVLESISIYDPRVGYVQGMNFIAGCFVYHSEEYIAFWCVVMIFEMLEMRDVYLPRLPGLSKHSQIIDFTILHYMSDLHSHFCNNNIKVEMFCSAWLFSLFGMIIPLQNQLGFYEHLVEEGWSYFYKLVIAYLEYKEEQLSQEDLVGILMILGKKNQRIYPDQEKEDDWYDLIQSAKQIKIDKKFISQMLNSFDPDKQRFSIRLSKRQSLGTSTINQKN